MRRCDAAGRTRPATLGRRHRDCPLGAAGRPGTAALLDDLEVLAARTVTYRDASFADLDVAAVLDRRPQLALVDELLANIESLGPLVSRITGVRPAEPVPDEFVRAGEITLVHLALGSPAALSTSARWRTGLTHRHSTGMEGPQWA
jgi:K+-sensing histidine kinase KdpD